jgi:hypothetical protein
MHRLKTSNCVKTLTGALVMLLAAGCVTTRDKISSLKESGECRKAEQLIKDEYSGQEERYNIALLYSECDGDYNKSLKIIKKMASDEYIPAMARLINLNAASSQMIKRYKILQCRNVINSQFYSRKQKISFNAKIWTLGGAKNGSGGLSRASVEADIWSDTERGKLAMWKNDEMKRCNSANLESTASFQNMPPPFDEIGKPSNTANKRRTQNRGIGDVFYSGSSINSRGQTMCQYKNGTNMNNGYDSICPMSISDRF